MQSYRFTVYGQMVVAERRDAGWQAFLPGNDGKRRPADFVIPDWVTEDGLAQYLEDLFHENATPRNGGVAPLA
ncbi:hypothetical protein KIF53_20865 [Chromobacterium subtsugae]|uniref:DUF7661 domain-containing protein n=1 Tax=Chromobacterium subtsugae TaxID=251747 RepID=A0ABS7FJ51_9NEIS|nr:MULTISPECIES: hypothetical protein [Chromobacterium]KUM04334.1 hypothetical protein Cv017_15190 [Chromobacterium subtsugae]KZE86175.1 hypothetical protein AWB61_16695 [Chromobacterium sp. F49]MBW7568021.1 hypothetical protein [Chromobacterium subtsugae]MBW8290097.1 hypothetical protein [Chromobacterium subtsugae]OBU86288.1 hypothetical protein MY55_11525 [Chromobacterium subtsugae]